jgi:hypothetical protein
VLPWLLFACAGEDPQVNATGVARAAPAPATTSTGGSAVTSRKPAEAAAAPAAATDPLRHQPDLPTAQRLLIVVDGEERIVDVKAAQAAGYTVIDLTDEWVPFIFEPMQDAEGAELPNRYRNIYKGLANDRADGDGQALEAGERNYLEVFGIPPSIGVLRDRFVADAESECHKNVDYELIAQLDAMTYRNKRKERRHKALLRKHKKAIKKALKKAKVETHEALVQAHPEAAAKVAKAKAYLDQAQLQIDALREIEERLECDGHMHKRYRHKKGKLDHGLRLALRRFQRRHKLYEHTNLRKKTMKTMGQRPEVTNHTSLRRTLKERVVDATSVIEDGTARKGGEPATYTGRDGKVHEVPNLVEAFTTAAVTQLGLDTPEKSLAFMTRHPRADFAWLKAGVKFPARPDYYGEHMDLEVIVDRGDVFYDPPWDDEGKKVKQYRRRLPKFYIYVTWEGQRFQLARWPTTIGGWRAEQAGDGYEYFKYKGSDVGRRVIRKIIAGPVWVPPATTPTRSLAKRRYVNGKAQGIVNYDEMGPGYLSAYGLVAGYFVIPGKNGRADHDRGIRAHGSSDYMSIRSPERFSHGCHRLLNHLSVRLYGFVLNHRTHEVAGDQPINHRRQFLMKEQVFEVRIQSRGFQYNLVPPLPVRVLEGNIRGKSSRPPEGLVKIPGKPYPDSMPGEEPKEDDSAGG